MGPGDPQTTMISMLVGGVVGALILVLAYFVGVALIGAALGALIVHLIWAQLGHEPHPLVVITGTVAGALGALALQRYVIIVATAFAGAWTALVGALAIAAGRSATTTDGWVLYPLRPPQGYEWMWIAWLVLGGVGLIVQILTRGRAPKPKAAR
jgi:drug/metabolite transporter (DMT)-like permease